MSRVGRDGRASSTQPRPDDVDLRGWTRWLWVVSDVLSTEVVAARRIRDQLALQCNVRRNDDQTHLRDPERCVWHGIEPAVDPFAAGCLELDSSDRARCER